MMTFFLVKIFSRKTNGEMKTRDWLKNMLYIIDAL